MYYDQLISMYLTTELLTTCNFTSTYNGNKKPSHVYIISSYIKNRIPIVLSLKILG